jgi:hypothetical protein
MAWDGINQAFSEQILGLKPQQVVLTGDWAFQECSANNEACQTFLFQ